MKAKKTPRIYLEKRTKLQDVIPIEVPYVIFVDPSSACNFQCEFCANGNREIIEKTGRKQGIMDFNLFKRIIDDIVAFKKEIKVLRLYKEGEPLLNPKLPEMIKYAKKAGIFESIDFTTNGSLLGPEKNKALIDAGLDKINISVEAMSSKKYKEISKVDLDFNKYVDNIRDFYKNKKKCVVLIKTIKNYLEEGEEEKFYDTFGDIADQVFVENLAPCWPEFDMKEFEKDFNLGIYGQQKERVEVCPYIFYSLTVNVDGTVSACYLDWEHKLILGDLNKESIVDIWNGKAFVELRKLHLKKKRKENPVCRNCGQLIFGAPDNLDDYAEELLKKIE